ncbi:MAG: MotA/TolQ/ExbB proton channel family protein [Planctomycetes bacterium]|nr:MotA/TolQ/ExbB proton channel family protein [Planctomycetota bacterium]
MKKHTLFTALLGSALLALVVCLFSAASVHAADDGAAAPAAEAGAAAGGGGGAEVKSELPQGPIAMVIASGFIGYIIILLSVVAVALSIENLIAIKREKMMPDDLLSDIEEALDAGEYEEALEICQAEDCMMTRILGAGLSKMANGFERMEEAMAEEADAQATMLHQKLGYINLIAGVAPMLGLLGTVSGMIGAFGEIASKPSANAQDLAGGIYVALMTTLLGLIVAIPSTAAFAFFRGRVVKILMVMGIITGEILDRFRPVEE